MTERILYLAGGCFWGTEHYLKQIDGILATSVGYANSILPHPSYEAVCTGATHAAETVQVLYDADRISLATLVDLYFKAIDPTLLNQQGHDVGEQYRTGIYFTDPAEEAPLQSLVAAQQAHYKAPIVVEVLPLVNFYEAETYHQDYLDKNPEGYCHLPVALFEFARQANKGNKE